MPGLAHLLLKIIYGITIFLMIIGLTHKNGTRIKTRFSGFITDKILHILAADTRKGS
jgi:hypothetical protein